MTELKDGATVAEKMKACRMDAKHVMAYLKLILKKQDDEIVTDDIKTVTMLDEIVTNYALYK